MILGIAVDFSAFLVIYQSVLDNSFATFAFKFLINSVFNSVQSFGVAVPYDDVTVSFSKTKIGTVLI